MATTDVALWRSARREDFPNGKGALDNLARNAVVRQIELAQWPTDAGGREHV